MMSAKSKHEDETGQDAKKRRKRRKNAKEDCEEGQIREDFGAHLVVHENGDKDNIMTEKQCRKLCQKNKRCKAFDYYEDECRGVSKIGKPRLGENPDGRMFCTMNALKETAKPSKDCEEGQIRKDFVTHLVVHEFGDKDNIMTEDQCR